MQYHSPEKKPVAIVFAFFRVCDVNIFNCVINQNECYASLSCSFKYKDLTDYLNMIRLDDCLILYWYRIPKFWTVTENDFSYVVREKGTFKVS